MRYWWLSDAMELQGYPDRLIVCVHHPSSSEDAGMDLYEALVSQGITWNDLEAAAVNVRLGKLAELYRQGQASNLMARTLEKLLAYEANISQEQLDELRSDVATFEAHYQMTSAEFFRKYQAGETDDRLDFVEWAAMVQMVENLQRRLELLSGELPE